MYNLSRFQQEFASLKADMERLAVEIPGRLPVKLALRPPPGPPVDPPEPRSSPDPVWTATEVLERWVRGGLAELRALGRRYITAVIAATADPQVGPRLSRDADFVALLVQVAPQRRLLPALARMYFHAYPPPAHLHAAISAQFAGFQNRRWPRWLAEVQWTSAPAEAAERALRDLSDGVPATDWVVLARELDLPSSLPDGPWAEQIVQRAVVDERNNEALDRMLRLLTFADGGMEFRNGSRMTGATVLAIKRLVRLVHHNQALRADKGVRDDVTGLLRARVGDFFQVASEAIWLRAGLDNERRILKTWRVSQIIDLVFRQLVPNNMSRHQTEERREFWSLYQNCVEAVWVFAHSALKARLETNEIHKLRRDGSLHVGLLIGANQQAVIWMLVRGLNGQLSTAIEGNANTRWRVWPGGHLPEDENVLEYSRLDAMEVEHRGDSGVHSQNSFYGHGVWQPRVRELLRNRGVNP